MAMKRTLAAVMVIGCLGACTSINSVTDRKLKVCEHLRDEHLRVDCITKVHDNGK